jgi:hypothetical protein
MDALLIHEDFSLQNHKKFIAIYHHAAYQFLNQTIIFDTAFCKTYPIFFLFFIQVIDID